MLKPPGPEAIAQATTHIEASIARSNPNGDTVADVLEAVQDGTARLWLGPRAAVVTATLQSAQIKVSELIWHAGGDLKGVLEILSYGEQACRMVGCDQLVLFADEGDTRRGWERVLEGQGFRKVTLLVKDLQE